MSWSALKWARTVETGDMAEQFVLEVLADYARDADWIAWPSQATIAQRIQASTKTVSRALARLEAKGLTCREQTRRAGGYRGSDRIWLCPAGDGVRLEDNVSVSADQGERPQTPRSEQADNLSDPTGQIVRAEPLVELDIAAASGDTCSDDTPEQAPMPAALTEAARILAEQRAARRTDLRNPAGWKHNTALRISHQDHPVRARELLVERPDLTGPELARLLEPSWWGVATTVTRDNAANALVGPRPWSPCGTCGGGRTVPATADPSRRAPCPACTGQDTEPVAEVELPAEPVAKPEVPQNMDPWGATEEGDASAERVTEGQTPDDASGGRVVGPEGARVALEEARKRREFREVASLPSSRMAGTLTVSNHLTPRNGGA